MRDAVVPVFYPEVDIVDTRDEPPPAVRKMQQPGNIHIQSSGARVDNVTGVRTAAPAVAGATENVTGSITANGKQPITKLVTV